MYEHVGVDIRKSGVQISIMNGWQTALMDCEITSSSDTVNWFMSTMV